MKLIDPSNYITWSYKAFMILLQKGLWRFVLPEVYNACKSGTTSDNDISSTNNFDSTNEVSPTQNISAATIPPTTGHLTQVQGHWIITSTVRDSIVLSIIHLTYPRDIWQQLRHMCNIWSSSHHLALKEQFYSLSLTQGKAIN
ncbi:hypothetical protein M758_UG298300, partial [Ceratodon purpureus]